MQPTWITKTDPVRHPVRYMAKIWQSTMQERFGVVRPEFTPKEYGQLKTLMKHLGELTACVLNWSVDHANWWHFCQRVRVAHNIRFVPDRPEIGFLLRYRGHALQMMHARSQESAEKNQRFSIVAACTHYLHPAGTDLTSGERSYEAPR